jgi:hypothetical protein
MRTGKRKKYLIEQLRKDVNSAKSTAHALYLIISNQKELPCGASEDESNELRECRTLYGYGQFINSALQFKIYEIPDCRLIEEIVSEGNTSGIERIHSRSREESGQFIDQSAQGRYFWIVDVLEFSLPPKKINWAYKRNQIKDWLQLIPLTPEVQKTVIRWIGSVLIVYQVLSAEGGVKLIDILVLIIKKALGLP